MNLYPKRLNSIKDLEKERELLLIESKKLNTEQIFSFKEKEITNKNGNEENILQELLPLASPIIENGISFITENFPTLSDKVKSIVKDNSKKVLISVGKEIIYGYLKWKAIELTFKAIRHIVKNKQKK